MRLGKRGGHTARPTIQKFTFKANCAVLGLFACDVTMPKLNGSLIFVAGPPKRTRLKALNISKRNSTFACSRNVVCFMMPKSSLKLWNTREFGRTEGALPYLNGAGSRNASILSHRFLAG